MEGQTARKRACLHVDWSGEDTVNEIVQFDLPVLLEKSGARPRGNRHDCPKCGSHRTVTHSDEAFFCHKCQWKGNTVTLARELGIFQHLSPAQYRELQRSREQADCAARSLYEQVRVLRFELMEQLRDLGRVQYGAHTKPNHPLAWDALSMGYGEPPALQAQLTILENCGASDLLRFLTTDNATRQWAINRVIEHGGLYDHANRFVEVCP